MNKGIQNLAADLDSHSKAKGQNSRPHLASQQYSTVPSSVSRNRSNLLQNNSGFQEEDQDGFKSYRDRKYYNYQMLSNIIISLIPYIYDVSIIITNPTFKQKYSLVSNEIERGLVRDRIDKNPKGFSPYDFDALYKIFQLGKATLGRLQCWFALLIASSMRIICALLVWTSRQKHSKLIIVQQRCKYGIQLAKNVLGLYLKLIFIMMLQMKKDSWLKSISHAYYRNSHGCVAVYDIANRASFDSIEEQIQSFIAYSAQDVARNIILVGNKTDLDDKRKVQYLCNQKNSQFLQNQSKVPFEEAVRLGKKLNLAAVFETSAKNNDSVDDSFFRSIVNCVDFYSTSNPDNDNSLLGKSKPKTLVSRKYSQQTDLMPRYDKNKKRDIDFNDGNRSFREPYERKMNNSLFDDEHEGRKGGRDNNIELFGFYSLSQSRLQSLIENNRIPSPDEGREQFNQPKSKGFGSYHGSSNQRKKDGSTNWRLYLELPNCNFEDDKYGKVLYPQGYKLRAGGDGKPQNHLPPAFQRKKQQNSTCC